MDKAKQFLFYLFMLVVILAPLPLGSNREWSWSLAALLIGGIALAWSVLSLLSPKSTSRLLNPLLIIGFIAVCAWALLQTNPAVPQDWTHPLWQMSGETVGANSFANLNPGTISLSPDQTYTATMRLILYGLVFYLAFQWGRNPKLAQRAFQWMVIAGLAYAIYGLGNFWSGSETLFWFEKSGYKQDVHSTFVNRNHYASYTGLLLLCALSLFYQRVALHGPTSTPMPGRGRIPPGARVTTVIDRFEEFALQVWKPLLVILVLSTALILSHSRGGFLSTLAGAAVLLYCFNHRRKIRNKRSLAVIGVAVGIAAISFWLTSEVLLKRLDRKGLSDNSRFSAYELITESSRDNPILGFGYGTFADSFRLYRSDEIRGYLDRAHNTYLENIFELGWPAAILLFVLIGSCCLVCIKGLRTRGRDWIYPATGIAATTLVAIHSYFDFSLQMPAVAMTYACILGVACAQSYSSEIT